MRFSTKLIQAENVGPQCCLQSRYDDDVNYYQECDIKYETNTSYVFMRVLYCLCDLLSKGMTEMMRHTLYTTPGKAGIW